MKKCIRRSAMWTSIGFISIMLYCIASMIDKFSYLDLAYLLVVICYFVAYLKNVSEL